jgi:DNA polymerase III subunit epsilon
MTHVNPETDNWSCSFIHGITAKDVIGAPTFKQVFPRLKEVLGTETIYQHSSFDSSAIAAACRRHGQSEPHWNWKDSVTLARKAWPELRNNGGHGLASLKAHLGLDFNHHDAEEDARASAEVVLRAEAKLAEKTLSQESVYSTSEPTEFPTSGIAATSASRGDKTPRPILRGGKLLGEVEITDGNVKNNHIYLRSFFEKFPDDAIGGSNSATMAPREVFIEWGGPAPTATDLDSQKRLFRKRGWIRTFFEQNGVKAGDVVAVIEVEPYQYRVEVTRR